MVKFTVTCGAPPFQHIVLLTCINSLPHVCILPISSQTLHIPLAVPAGEPTFNFTAASGFLSAKRWRPWVLHIPLAVPAGEPTFNFTAASGFLSAKRWRPWVLQSIARSGALRLAELQACYQ